MKLSYPFGLMILCLCLVSEARTSFASPIKVTQPPKKSGKNRGKKSPAPVNNGGSPISIPVTPVPTTGLELIAPKDVPDLPVFRVTTPEGKSEGNPFGLWTPLAPDEADTINPSTTFRQRVPLEPGVYRLNFSRALPSEDGEEKRGAYTWYQPVRVIKREWKEVEVKIPPMSADSVAHVQFKVTGLVEPFNLMTLEWSGAEGEGPSGRFEYFMPQEGWPGEIKVALLPGPYKMILTNSSLGAFASLRYEFPQPFVFNKDTVIDLKRPEPKTLKVKVLDSKGGLIPRLPLFFQGTGATFAYVDSESGDLLLKLPIDRYKVYGMTFTDKGQKQILLDKDLDMSQDQVRVWNTKIKGPAFGASLIPSSPSPPINTNP